MAEKSVTVADIYEFLESFAPFENQEQWDNSGLLVGRFDKKVEKVALVLDVCKSTVQGAIKLSADLIISHHPLIFKPRKNFLSSAPEYLLAQNDISVISTHTCLDSTDEGVNDVLCARLGIKNIRKLETKDTTSPIVRIGEIEKTNACEFAEKIKKSLDTKVSFADAGKEIKNVAVCTGAGADFIKDVLQKNVDAYVTGEAGYHAMLDAKESGLSVFCAGHFETEKPAMNALGDKIKEKFNDIEILEIDEKCPIKYC